MSKLKTLFIDSHVHIYPNYNLARFLRHCLNNMRKAGKKSSFLGTGGEALRSGTFVPILMLAERSDCDFFGQVLKATKKYSHAGVRILPSEEKESVIIEQVGKSKMYVIAGRQIITREGLEILSLASTMFIEDGVMDAAGLIRRINESGGIPVVNWAPGKWLFFRGKVVGRVIGEHQPDQLFLGDTSLRTRLWPVPKLMREARQMGFKVLAGSDPHQFSGEEKYVGSYGVALTGEFDSTRSAYSVCTLFKSAESEFWLVGKRNGLMSFCWRQGRAIVNKKRRNGHSEGFFRTQG